MILSGNLFQALMLLESGRDKCALPYPPEPCLGLCSPQMELEDYKESK